MKAIIIISLTIIAICNAQANSPAVKAALSYDFISQLQTTYVAPNIQALLEAALPREYNFQKKVPVIGEITLDLSDIALHSFTVDWNKSSLLAPSGQNQFSIILDDVSLELALHYQANVIHIKESGNCDITIEGLSANITIGQQQASNGNYGFVISSSSIIVDQAVIHFSDKFLEIATKIISKIFGKEILHLFSSIAEKLIADKISPILYNKTVNGFSYLLNGEVEFTATIQELFLNAYLPGDTYGCLGVNIDVTDIQTNSEPSLTPVTDMPDYFNDETDVQVFVSQNLLEQLIWGVFLAEDISLTISKLPPSVPFALNTSQMAIIVPQLLTQFGPNLGMYLNLTDSNSVSNIVIRDGRIVGVIGFLIDMWVDTSSQDYPQQGFQNCVLQGNCELAVGMDASFFFALDVFNINSTFIGVNLMDIAVSDLSVTFGPATQQELQTVLNDLLSSVIPMVNQEFGEGIENPIIGKYGISAMDIDVLTDYLRVALAFDIQ